MEVQSSEFCHAIDYVSKFIKNGDLVLFSPSPERNFVRVSVLNRANGAYGEFWMKPIQPLRERFAVPVARLPAIAAEVKRYETVRYARQSMALFESGGQKWWVIEGDPEEVERPELKDVIENSVGKSIQNRIVWGKGFAASLRLMIATVGRDDSPRWPDIQFEHVKDDLRMSAATLHAFSVTWERANDRQYLKILIDRQFAPHLLGTAIDDEVGSEEVEFRIGLSRVSVECGRRKAIFPRSSREFPQYKALEDKLTDHPGNFVEVDASRLARVARQILLVDTTMCLDVQDELVGCQLACTARKGADDGEMFLEGTKGGKTFARTKVSADYIADLAGEWPETKTKIQSLPGDRHLLLATERAVSLIASVEGPSHETSKETADSRGSATATGQQAEQCV